MQPFHVLTDTAHGEQEPDIFEIFPENMGFAGPVLRKYAHRYFTLLVQEYPALLARQPQKEDETCILAGWGCQLENDRKIKLREQRRCAAERLVLQVTCPRNGAKVQSAILPFSPL